MRKMLLLLLISLLISCHTETTGEYRWRLINKACECVSKVANFNKAKDLPDGNVINAMSKNTKDSLLKNEEKTLSNINDCLQRNKLSKSDIMYFWNDYDIGKMPLCDSAFEDYHRYIFQLIHGSY